MDTDVRVTGRAACDVLVLREAAKRFEIKQAAKLRDMIKEFRTKEFLFA